jgi:hypothetical protein
MNIHILFLLQGKLMVLLMNMSKNRSLVEGVIQDKFFSKVSLDIKPCSVFHSPYFILFGIQSSIEIKNYAALTILIIWSIIKWDYSLMKIKL